MYSMEGTFSLPSLHSLLWSLTVSSIFTHFNFYNCYCSLSSLVPCLWQHLFLNSALHVLIVLTVFLWFLLSLKSLLYDVYEYYSKRYNCAKCMHVRLQYTYVKDCLDTIKDKTYAKPKCKNYHRSARSWNIGLSFN